MAGGCDQRVERRHASSGCRADYGVAVATSSCGCRLPTTTVSEFDPATVPRVHLAVTSPSALVIADCGVITPPPLVIWNATDTPTIGVFVGPTTRMTMDVGSCTPTFPVWLLPCATTIAYGRSAVAEMETGSSPGTAASSRCVASSGPTVH